MNTELIKESWTEQKNKLKARFLRLTNADLNFDACKSDVMFNKVQVRLGKTRPELLTILASL